MRWVWHCGLVLSSSAVDAVVAVVLRTTNTTNRILILILCTIL